jgi:4-azaleucine resistance transporter AzlC
MQYVAVGLMTGGASLITVALTTLMVNARHLFYGVSMIDKYKNVGKRKPYLIFSLTDETYSLLCNDIKDIDEKHKKDYYLFVSLFNHLYWILGTILGVLVGTLINFNTQGIDFALTALFLTVFLEQWMSTKKHTPALIGVLSSVICLLVFGKDNFLIPSMIIITIFLLMFKEKNNG